MDRLARVQLNQGRVDGVRRRGKFCIGAVGTEGLANATSSAASSDTSSAKSSTSSNRPETRPVGRVDDPRSIKPTAVPSPQLALQSQTRLLPRPMEGHRRRSRRPSISTGSLPSPPRQARTHRAGRSRNPFLTVHCVVAWAAHCTGVSSSPHRQETCDPIRTIHRRSGWLA